ncbi:MAG: sugar phosphate isomerase/epimerase family protein [Candidatus Bipolaricaulia bacterium]
MTQPSLGLILKVVGTDENRWEEEAKFVQAFDPDHVELWLEYPEGNETLSERQLRRIRNLVKGVRITMHGPFWGKSLVTPHHKHRQVALDELNRTLELGTELKSELMTVHGGVFYLESLRKEIDYQAIFRENLEELLSVAEAHGQILAIENLPASPEPNRTYPTAIAELRESLAFDPRLWGTFDVGHSMANGEDPEAVLDGVLDRVINIHLHDFSPDRGSHQELGTGLLNLEGFIERLRGYDRFLTLEIIDDEDGEKIRRSFARMRGLMRGDG